MRPRSCDRPALDRDRCTQAANSVRRSSGNTSAASSSRVDSFGGSASVHSDHVPAPRRAHRRRDAADLGDREQRVGVGLLEARARWSGHRSAADVGGDLDLARRRRARARRAALAVSARCAPSRPVSFASAAWICVGERVRVLLRRRPVRSSRPRRARRPRRGARGGACATGSCRSSRRTDDRDPRASGTCPRTRVATSWLTIAVRVALDRRRDRSREPARSAACASSSKAMHWSSAARRLSAPRRACAATHEPHTGRPLTVATTDVVGSRRGGATGRRPAARRAAAAAGRAAAARERRERATRGAHDQSRCTRASRAISLPTEITATPITITSSAAT